MEKLIEIIHAAPMEWSKTNQDALDQLFGAQQGRYPSRAKDSVKLRAPKMTTTDGVSFSAYIHPTNPDVGAYGGMCFVIFPVDDGPCLVAMGIGTQGLSPDEAILSRPGHARKVAAICHWLNHKYGNGKLIAWAKQDPTRIDQEIPEHIKKTFSKYHSVFTRYGKVLYGLFVPDANNPIATLEAVKAFLDLTFEERGYSPLAAYENEANEIRNKYFEYILPTTKKGDIVNILRKRRFGVLEGPPGTGKTYIALKILDEDYKGNGVSIQFHPNTTYENFIGGLSPTQSEDGLGFSFTPKPGYLMEAIIASIKDPQKPYLLHIDEINRADLAKVLGEAIFLFEAQSDGQRVVKLAYDYGIPSTNQLRLPENLHVLGTMNSSDRSIAIMDIAIRRRFAFMKLWPQMSVVKENSCARMIEAFRNLLEIFIEYAGDDALKLIPGHAYFLEKDSTHAKEILQTSLYPLLEEYLAQGYVAGFSEHIVAYMQWINSL